MDTTPTIEVVPQRESSYTGYTGRLNMATAESSGSVIEDGLSNIVSELEEQSQLDAMKLSEYCSYYERARIYLNNISPEKIITKEKEQKAFEVLNERFMVSLREHYDSNINNKMFPKSLAEKMLFGFDPYEIKAFENPRYWDSVKFHDLENSTLSLLERYESQPTSKTEVAQKPPEGFVIEVVGKMLDLKKRYNVPIGEFEEKIKSSSWGKEVLRRDELKQNTLKYLSEAFDKYNSGELSRELFVNIYIGDLVNSAIAEQHLGSPLLDKPEYETQKRRLESALPYEDMFELFSKNLLGIEDSDLTLDDVAKGELEVIKGKIRLFALRADRNHLFNGLKEYVDFHQKNKEFDFGSIIK